MSLDAQVGLEVEAADGTILATDVFHPRAGGPWPVVLIRTYLGKAQHAAEAMGWARRGFACAVQDVRGRYDSGGEWRPYTSERGDGRDAVRWLLRQPWCSGQVVAAGGSYGAFTAWASALSHPSVRAVVSAVPAMGPMPLQPEDGGVLPLLSRAAWWSTHAGARCARHGIAEAQLEHASEALLHLPVVDLPRRLWAPLQGWREAVLETALETTLETTLEATLEATVPVEKPALELISEADLASLDAAALHVGAWHDPFCAETLRHFELVGRGQEPRPPRALVLGPWWHRLDASRPSRYGERHYGRASRFALGSFQAEWLRCALRGECASLTRRVFLCGENRWLEEPPWEGRPLETSTFYASADRLSPEPPRTPGEAAFVYDPRDPHPCRRTPLDETGLPPRDDLVSFETVPFDRACRILGAPRVVVWGRGKAPSIDWVARLLEVTADGRRLYLAHGLVDAARALGMRGEELEPAVPHRVEIRLSPLGFSVPVGSRLRLEITGSAFPSYARNLASGEPRLTGSKLATASQTVCWGPERATALELPLFVEVSEVAGDASATEAIPEAPLIPLRVAGWPAAESSAAGSPAAGSPSVGDGP